jgi:hypothetical protein
MPPQLELMPEGFDPFASAPPSPNVENRIGETPAQRAARAPAEHAAEYQAHRDAMSYLRGTPIPTTSPELSRQAGIEDIPQGYAQPYITGVERTPRLFDTPTPELDEQFAGLWDKLFPREKPTREYPGPQLQNPEGAFNIPLIAGRGQGGVMPKGAPIEQMGVVRGEGRLPKGRNLADQQLHDWLGTAGSSRQSLEQYRDFLAQNRGGVSTSREGKIATLSAKDVERAIKLINDRIQSMQLDEEFAPLVKEIARKAQFEAEGGQISTGGSPVEKRYGGSKFKVPDFGPGTEGEIKALRGWLESTQRDHDIIQRDPTLARLYRDISRRLRQLEGK